MEKYLYFRTQATIGDDDDIAQSVMHPASSFVGGYPTSDTALTLAFRSMNNIATSGDNEVVVADTVVLTTATNKAKEALQDIVSAINAHPNGDPFIVVADDLSTGTSYVGGGNITACAAITTAAANS